MLGLGGAAIGLAAGLALAPALDQLFKAFGADLPDSGTVLEFRTVWVSLLAGTAVTVVAGLLPAIRASRVTPIAALREGVSLRERAPRSRRRRLDRPRDRGGRGRGARRDRGLIRRRASRRS